MSENKEELSLHEAAAQIKDQIDLEKAEEAVKDSVAQEVVEQVSEEQTAEPTTEVNTVEAEARSKGWKPEEEFDGNKEGKRFVSAEEFLDREKFFEKISSQSSRIKKMESVLEKMHEHVQRSEKAAYDKALTDLQTQKTLAVQDGDVEKFKSLDQQHADLMQQQIQTETASQQAQDSERQSKLAEFQQKNPWFNVNASFGDDYAMTTYALGISHKLAQTNPGLSLEDELKVVEDEVKKTFAHKFNNPNKEKPAQVLPSTGKPSTGGKPSITMKDLPADHQQICRDFCKMIPGYSEEQYIKELIDQGVIKDE